MSPLGIIRGARPGTLNIRGMGVGFPGTHSQARSAGSGTTSIERPIYYRESIANNVANSSHQLDWLTEAGSDVLWDNPPIALTFQLSSFVINANQSALYFAIGDVPSFNSLAAFNQWRTDNPAQKRVMITVERDATGIITWFLAWADGANVNSITMPAISADSWISLNYQPSPRRAEVYVNGNLHVASASIDLPLGAGTGTILASIGLAKKLADAALIQWAMFAPCIIPVRAF